MSEHVNTRVLPQNPDELIDLAILSKPNLVIKVVRHLVRFVSKRGQDDGLAEVVHRVLELLHLEQDVPLQQEGLNVATVKDASLVSEKQGPETIPHCEKLSIGVSLTFHANEVSQYLRRRP